MSNEIKQTAVEWLVKQISTSKYFYKLMEDINSRSTVAQSDIFEQAKAMEKEQQGYSKEEVIILLQKYRLDLSSGKTPNLGDTTKQWLEQFKKK